MREFTYQGGEIVYSHPGMSTSGGRVNARRWDVLCYSGDGRSAARDGGAGAAATESGDVACALARLGRRAAVCESGARALESSLAPVLVQTSMVYAQSCVTEELARLAALARQAGAEIAIRSELAVAAQAAPLADIVFIDASQDAARAGAAPGPAVLRRLLALGPEAVIMWLGRQGAIAAAGARYVDIPLAGGVQPEGACNRFAASFIDAWLDGQQLDAALQRACAQAR